MQLDMELLPVDLSSGRSVVVGFFMCPFFSIFKCRCEFAFLLFQHSSSQPVRRPYRTPSEQPSKLPVKFSRKKPNFSAIFAAGQYSRRELQLDVLAKGSRFSILPDQDRIFRSSSLFQQLFVFRIDSSSGLSCVQELLQYGSFISFQRGSFQSGSDLHNLFLITGSICHSSI